MHRKRSMWAEAVSCAAGHLSGQPNFRCATTRQSSLMWRPLTPQTLTLAVYVCLALAILCGCRTKRQNQSAPHQIPAAGNTYLDLQPGWRLRAIVPLLQSGSYALTPSRSQKSGSTITVNTGSDFLGYETDYYTIESRGRHGVQIAFASADVTRNDRTVPAAQPKVNLFASFHRTRYVRLLYLQRVSEADHNMAALGANRRDLLEDFTRRVQSDPAACQGDRQKICAWIPLGIAVRTEQYHQDFAQGGGKGDWEPVR